MTDTGERGQRGFGSSWPWVVIKGAWSTGDYTDDTETRSTRLWRQDMRSVFLKLVNRLLRRPKTMEQQCIEAYDRGDCKPFSEVIAELKAKIEEAKRQ